MTTTTSRTAAENMRAANVLFDAEHGNLVDTNASNDFWHGKGQHANGAIADCALCVAEDTRLIDTDATLARRAERLAYLGTHTRASLYTPQAAGRLHTLIARRYGIRTRIESTGGRTMVQTLRLGSFVFTVAGESLDEAHLALWAASDWDGETDGEPLILDGLTPEDAAEHVRIALANAA